MIMRIWHGITRNEKGEDFHKYLMKTGVNYYRSQQGNRGVFVLRRVQNDKTHFLLLSLWDSLEAIAKFAGSDIDKAMYFFSEDQIFLEEMEPNVLHYEILAGPVMKKHLEDSVCLDDLKNDYFLIL